MDHEVSVEIQSKDLIPDRNKDWSHQSQWQGWSKLKNIAVVLSLSQSKPMKMQFQPSKQKMGSIKQQRWKICKQKDFVAIGHEYENMNMSIKSLDGKQAQGTMMIDTAYHKIWWTINNNSNGYNPASIL